MRKKRILVTGGAGSIGQELIRQLAPNNKIFILDINETGAFDLREELKWRGYWVHSRTGDIRNKETVHDVFSDFKPQIILHAAALKHVTPCEEYPQEAIDTNIQGTLNVISEARKWDCFEKFMFISTDKVASDECVMATTKDCAEKVVRSRGKGFVAVRFGNVMGSRGSVLEIWQRQIHAGEPLTITDPNMERYAMTIPQACSLVIEATEKGDNGELWILDMGKKVKIIDLANRIIDSIKYDRGIKIIGVRPGETMTEKLMTQEEEARAEKKGNFWIIK